MKVGTKVKRNTVLADVLHVPGLSGNLFSVRTAADNGKIVQFGHSQCWIKDCNGSVRATGTMRNKLYELDCESTTIIDAAHVMKTTGSKSELWHQRFGHVNSQTLRKMVSLETVLNLPKLNILDNRFCEACV